MIIRYRRYLNSNSKDCPPITRVISTPLLFVPCRTITRQTWARPFIVFTLPPLASY